MAAYFSSLHFSSFLNGAPGGVAQGLIWGIMALGVFLTFRILNFADLTVDGSLATGGAVCIMLILKDWNPYLALLVSTLSGVLAGFVTGMLHTRLGIPDILAGILTQISLYSINLNIMGKANQAINVNALALKITSNSKRLPTTILIMAIICIALVSVIYWYLGTEHGSSIRATGANPNMSRAQGINTDNMKVVGLCLSNGLVALAGGILSQYQGFADVNMGRGAIVIGLAAVIIGEVIGEAVLGKHLNFYLRLLFVVIGSIIYYIVYVFVIWLKFPPNDMKLLTAIVVAVFLAVPYLKNASQTSFRRAGKRSLKSRMEGNKNA